MQIIKEQLDIDEVLEKRIKNILKFLNVKSKLLMAILFTFLKLTLHI